MSFQEWKINHNAKKQEKKLEKEEKVLEAYKKANDKQMELSEKKAKIHTELETEKRFTGMMDEAELNERIRKARQDLFIQRDKLVRRITSSNREYKYYMDMPDSVKKSKELSRCSSVSKNAIYALSVVDQAIERLDRLPDEYEWHNIMRDLTQGYKTVNAISVGSDLITKLAFWFQKARMDIKGDISVNAMEHYYGKPIDQLLESEGIDKLPSELLVNDDALNLLDSQDILEAVKWGTVYNVQPSDLASLAAEQSAAAAQSGAAPSIPNPTEENFNVSSMNIDDFLDSMPSNM